METTQYHAQVFEGANKMTLRVGIMKGLVTGLSIIKHNAQYGAIYGVRK